MVEFVDIGIREVGRGGRTIKRDLNEIGIRSVSTSRQVDRLNASSGRLDRSFRSTAVGARAMQAAFAAVAGSLLLRELIRTTDTMSLMRSRLRLVTDSMKELTLVQRELFRVSQQTRTQFESNVDLFSSLSRATKSLNLDQQTLIALTQSTSQAMQISGATTQAAAATIVQFGQALTGNFKSSSQELNSILEQASRLAQALADGLNETGVTSNATAASLKRLAEDGILNTTNVLNALLSQSDKLNREFSGVERTVGGAMTQLGNSFARATGFANDSAGATGDLTSAIDELRVVVESPNFQTGMTFLLAAIAGIATVAAAAVRDVGAFVDQIERLTSGQGSLQDIIDTLPAPGFSVAQAIAKRLTASPTAVTIPVPPDTAGGTIPGIKTEDTATKTNETVDALKREVDQLTRVSAAVRKSKEARDQVADSIEAENLLIKEEIDLNGALAGQIQGLVVERNSLVRAIENQDAQRDLIVATREEVSALHAQAAALRISEERFLVVEAAQDIFSQSTGLSAAKALEMGKALVVAREGLNDLNEALQRGRQLTEELRTPTEVYLDTLRDLDGLLASSAINQETFNRGISRAQDDFRKATDSTRELQRAFDELGATFQSAFEDAVLGGESLSEILRALGQDVARLGLRFAVTEPLFGGLRNGFNGEDSGAEGFGGIGEFLGKGLRELFGETPLPGAGPTVAATVSGGIAGEIGGFGFPQADQFGQALAKQAETLNIFGQSVIGAGAGAGVLEAAQGGVSEVISSNVVPALAQQAVGTATETTVTQLATTALTTFTAAVAAATLALQTMATAGAGGGAGQILSSVLSIGGAAAGGGFQGGGSAAFTAFAAGGFVQGRGTGTSDSIVARLSNGEAVIPADVVRSNLSLVRALIDASGTSLMVARNDNIPAFQRGGLAAADLFGAQPVDLARFRESMEVSSRGAALARGGAGGGDSAGSGRRELRELNEQFRAFRKEARADRRRANLSGAQGISFDGFGRTLEQEAGRNGDAAQRRLRRS